MEIQENVPATPRQMFHLQVTGEFNQEEMTNLVTQFHETALQGGVIATPANVVANVITTTSEISGLILTPKLSAIEIAGVVVEALRGLDVGQGNEASPAFADLDEDAKVEILNRIQHLLRFGSLPAVDGPSAETRDAIFVSVTRALGSKLVAPNQENLIIVTRIAQKEGDEDFDVSFKDLVQGDIFKHGDATFVAESNPYVNWIANPLPIITLDAKLYQAPEVTSMEMTESAPSKKKVQSASSKSTAKSRKK
jgi:hypothetical protein